MCSQVGGDLLRIAHCRLAALHRLLEHLSLPELRDATVGPELVAGHHRDSSFPKPVLVLEDLQQDAQNALVPRSP